MTEPTTSRAAGAASSRAGGGALPDDYEWPTDPTERLWGGRLQDVEVVRARLARLPEGPHRHLFRALILDREGHQDEALEVIESLMPYLGALDPLWQCRLLQMRGGLLHSLGLASQALESREQAVVLARRSGNPMAVILSLHELGVSLERTDGERARHLYHRTVELSDTVTGLPEDARLDLESLRALAVINLHLLCARTGLPLPEGTPGLEEAEERCRESWSELSWAIHAFRGLQMLDEGDEEAALALFADLPDPAEMQDGDHAVMVATGVAHRMASAGEVDEAAAMLDSVSPRVAPQFRAELLDVKAAVYERAGRFREACAVLRELTEGIQSLYGDEARATVRALEVYYRTEEHRAAATAAHEQSHAVQALADEWREASFRDPLTHVWNRRYLDTYIADLGGSTGHQVAVIDLDEFKTVNDRWGHALGDEVLLFVADAIRAACPDDVCVRHGGDEFCLVRPAGTPGRLEDTLAGLSHLGCPSGVGRDVTVSIGVATVGADGFDAALARADEAMYQVKRTGGGGLHVAQTPLTLPA